MKIVKRIVIALIAIIVLLQIPFVYRRYEVGQLAGKIASLRSQRVQIPNPAYRDLKGIIHAHTSLGGHSHGSFDELIDAANTNGLDFVLMTEHYSDKFDTSALTLNGVYGKTLFIGGHEVDTSTSDRFLLIPGSADAAKFREMPAANFLERVHSENKLAYITYPEKFNSWDSNFDGIEVFSVHTSAKELNKFVAFFDLIWSFPAYPELTLARGFERPNINLQKFDEIAAKRDISLFAGTDAHSNIGLHLFGDETGKEFIGFKVDPYVSSMRLARMHVLLPAGEELTRDTLQAAMQKRHFFTGFDVLGDTTGFMLAVENGNAIMGDEVPFTDGMTLKATAPLPARIVFYKNGQAFGVPTQSGEAVNYGSIAVDGPGAYRVEVYLDQLGAPFDKMPWILSNPIYIR